MMAHLDGVRYAREILVVDTPDDLAGPDARATPISAVIVGVEIGVAGRV